MIKESDLIVGLIYKDKSSNDLYTKDFLVGEKLFDEDYINSYFYPLVSIINGVHKEYGFELKIYKFKCGGHYYINALGDIIFANTEIYDVSYQNDNFKLLDEL